MSVKVKYQIIACESESFGFKIPEELLHEGESEEPFEELHKFKRRTFGDVSDKEFRASSLRIRLKHLFNCGGEIKIKIIR